MEESTNYIWSVVISIASVLLAVLGACFTYFKWRDDVRQRKEDCMKRRKLENADIYP